MEIRQFLEELSSGNPTPGGGSASQLRSIPCSRFPQFSHGAARNPAPLEVVHLGSACRRGAVAGLAAL